MCNAPFFRFALVFKVSHVEFRQINLVPTSDFISGKTEK
jgi:hypothetical protein